MTATPTQPHTYPLASFPKRAVTSQDANLLCRELEASPVSPPNWAGLARALYTMYAPHRGRPQWYPDSTSLRPRRDYNGDQGRSPAGESVRPHLHLQCRCCTSAHTNLKAPVGPAHGLTTLRSWQSPSTSGRRRPSPSKPPYFPTGVAGGVANISEAHGPSNVTHKQRADCSSYFRTYFLSGFAD